MKRWEYSKGWKALALILNQVCAVVLSIAVCMVSVGNNGFRLFKEDDIFENTSYFQREAREQIFGRAGLRRMACTMRRWC